MITRFDELLKQHNLEDKIELRGSFCMERCGEGLNWEIGDLPITSKTVEEAVETFMEKLVAPHSAGGPPEAGGQD
jgi:NADH-quinone oxidoreductase subunit G